MAGPRLGRAETVSARLLRLETRLARAERQLRAALALRGRLRLLEQRLERSGAGEAARGAAGGGRGPLRDGRGPPGQREWRAPRGWQRAPRRAGPSGGSRDAERLGPAGGGGGERPPGRAGGEDGTRPGAPRSGDGGGTGGPAGTGTEETIIHIKQEEELCATAQQQGEAGEAPEESCQEQGSEEPEASSQARKGRELYPRELPSTEGENFPREPDSGFQPYSTQGVSWIKQEEEPHCPEPQASGKEETSTDWSTAHSESTRRDPPADSFDSITCGSEAPGRPGEKFSKDPSPGVTWDSRWGAEPVGTGPTGQGLGGDVQYERGLGEQLGLLSPQENSLGRGLCVHSKCEGSSSQLETLQGAGEGEAFPAPTCEQGLGERGLGAAPAPCEGPQLDGGQTPPCGTLPADPTGLLGEEQPPGESQETPPETPTRSPCWEPARDKAEACACCPQHPAPRAAPPPPPQSQGRGGKSYICSDCGKSFVCHSWLLRHQMTHTGERPYQCSQCDKRYRRKDYLLSHLRRHAGQGAFQCPLCRKSFVLRRSFLRHQESHVQDTALALPAWPCADVRGAVMHSF